MKIFKTPIFLLLLQLLLSSQETIFNQNTFYKFKRFGYYTHIGKDTIIYPLAGGRAASAVRYNYSFCTTYEIKHNSRSSDFIELNYSQEDYNINDSYKYKKHFFTFMMERQKRHLFSPHWQVAQNGGIMLQLYGTPNLNASNFSSEMVPIYRYLSTGSTITNVTGSPKISGGLIGLNLKMGLIYNPNDKVLIQNMAGGYLKADLERVSGTSPEIVSSLYVKTGLNYSLQFLFNMKVVQPYFTYSLFFLERENGITSPDFKSKINYRHLFFIGIHFKFSLVCFG